MEKKKQSFSKEVRKHKRILYDLFATIENIIIGNSLITRGFKDGCTKYEIRTRSNYHTVVLVYEETTSERGILRNNNFSKELKEEDSLQTESVKRNKQTTNINMKKLKLNISNSEIFEQYSFAIVAKPQVNYKRIIYDLLVTIENIIIGASSVTRDVIDERIAFKIKPHQPTVFILYELSSESENNDSILQLIGDREKDIMKNSPYLTRPQSMESHFENMNMAALVAIKQEKQMEPLNLVSIKNSMNKLDINNPGVKYSSQELVATIRLEDEGHKSDFTGNELLYFKKLCKIKTEPSTFESENNLINVKRMNSNRITEKLVKLKLNTKQLEIIYTRNEFYNKCNKSFQHFSSKAINEPVGMQTGRKLDNCQSRGKTVTKLQNIKCHERQHVKEKSHIYECSDKTLVCSSHKIRHERNNTGEKPYKCEYCEKTFTQLHAKTCHERIHSGEKPYKSGYCKKTFAQLSHTKSHERLHSGEKPHKCEYCEKRFTQLHAKTCHERTHSGEKPYKCDYCEKTFAQFYAKKIHERTHTGEKPYKCGYCEKAFAQLSHIKSHERLHTGEKPYKCDYCQKTFACFGNKKSHERLHTGEKPYKCGYCEKTFADLSNKKSHERLHTGEKPYKCGYCEKTFPQLSNKISHERQHTGI